MKQIQIKETKIPAKITSKMASMEAYWEDGWVDMGFEVYLKSAMHFLSTFKNKKNDEILEFIDMKGNFILAAIVSYTENENPDLPGNWNLEFTFYPEDLPQVETGHNKSNDPRFFEIVNTTSNDLYHINPKSDKMVMKMIDAIFSTLKTYLLEQPVEPGEVLSYVHDGYFVAEVQMGEDGNKIITFTPDGAMKKIIKDDYALQGKDSISDY